MSDKLSEIYIALNKLIKELDSDLICAESGNKAACRRFRVLSLEFEKLAKEFRKKSIQEEKIK